MAGPTQPCAKGILVWPSLTLQVSNVHGVHADAAGDDGSPAARGVESQGPALGVLARHGQGCLCVTRALAALAMFLRL